MKTYKLVLMLFAVLMLTGTLSAQDDLYFNPDRDRVFTDKYSANADARSTEKNYSYQDEEDYDDEVYDAYDNYDYYYTSRIRRFQRPMYGFNFYDPFYVDMFYYDPFLSPFTTTLIYDSFYGWNNWNRWNRWNNFGWGGNSWGWNIGLGWNTWDPWYSWNGWGAGYYGFNNFYNYGFGSGFYCPPTWGTGYYYNTVNDIRNNTYYGPRTSGTTRVPVSNDREIRRDATNTPRDGVNPDRTPSYDPNSVAPRDNTTATPSTRARAHEERRRTTEGTDAVTPRDYTPRESTNRTRQSTETPRRNYEPSTTAPRTRTYEPPRQTTPERQRSSGWDNGNSRSGGFDRGNSSSGSSRSSGSSSSGSSSAPRSSSSSRRGGN